MDQSSIGKKGVSGTCAKRELDRDKPTFVSDLDNG
jgi:hypothetical protein